MRADAPQTVDSGAGETVQPSIDDAPLDAPEAQPLPALGSPPDPITVTDSFGSAGRKAMWTHVERLLAREGGLADPKAADDLRKYRVAIRRLRAAARMFAGAYPDREIRPIRRGLSDLGDRVGAVRDLDLRIADLARWSKERGAASRKGGVPLREAWSLDRQRAIGTLLANVATRRHRRLLERLVTFVEKRPMIDGRVGFAGPTTIGDRLGSTIWAAYEEVRAFAAVVRWADLETLHRLRIATKRLRDNVEFLGGVLGPTHAPVVERLVALQDHLGAMNDAAVTAAAVRGFLEDRHAQLGPTEASEIAAYLADREQEVDRLKRSSVRPWRAVTGIAFARRLARLVVVPAGIPAPVRRTPPRDS